MKEEKPYLYTNTEWEDLLEYNGMTWIGIDRFKAVQEENKSLQSQLKAKDKIIGKIEKYFIKEIIKLKKIKEDVSADYYIDRKSFLQEAITEINKILSKGEKE